MLRAIVGEHLGLVGIAHAVGGVRLQVEDLLHACGVVAAEVGVTITVACVVNARSATWNGPRVVHDTDRRRGTVAWHIRRE